MDNKDKEIKHALKDASLWLSDAAKRWPKHKDIARNNLRGGMRVIDSVYDDVMVNRPLGAEDAAERVLGSMVNGF